MDKWIGVIALAAPIVQTALMGFVGYPLARRRPGGIEAFRRSGFTWWLITLALLVLLALVTVSGALDLGVPSDHDLTALRIVATVAVAVGLMLAIESAGELWDRRVPTDYAQRGRQRYESALPGWARDKGSEAALVSVTAVLEEAVYRAIALGAFVTAWELDKPIAAGAVAVAFGLAHWYYGPRVVLVKMLVGSVLCAAALSGGWVAALVAHVLLNLVLTTLAQRGAR